MSTSTEYLPVTVHAWRFIPGTSERSPVEDDLIEVTLRFQVGEVAYSGRGARYLKGKVRTLEDWRYVRGD